MNRLVFTGIQATGKIHLGNYLGSIKPFLDKFKSDKKYFSIADYHSLSNIFVDESSDDLFDIGENSFWMLSTMLAAGLDKNKDIIFLQSSIKSLHEFNWILSTICPPYILNRMTQYKSKKSNNSNISLYTYPLWMASDILSLNSEIVPVGQDQVQHLELTRNLAHRVNNILLNNNDFKLNIPEQYIENKTKKIFSLKNGTEKMSKSSFSDYSRINLIDNEDTIRKKILKSKTDSIEKLFYNEKRPEINNLMNIYTSFINITNEELEEKYKNKNILQFKKDLIDILIKEICPVGDKILEYMNEKQYLLDLLNKNQIKIEEIINSNLNKIKSSINLLKIN